MADFYYDPSAATNGTGTFASPRNTWVGFSPSAGNRYLQKFGTTYAGVIGPFGTGGTAGSRIVIGVYDPDTGAIMDDVKGGAAINAAGQTYGFNITESRPYITVSGFEVYGATAAGAYKASTASSSTEDQYTWFDNCVFRDNGGAGLDIRGKGNRLRNCDVYGNASDGLFVVGDDFELSDCNVYGNGLTNSDGDGVQLRDSSNFVIQDSVIDHSRSDFKQALLVSLLNVAGTTGGRIVNTHILCAQHVSGVTPADQKTLQILTPNVRVRRCTIEGGQSGAYMQGVGGVLEDCLLVVTGAGAVGVAVREDDVSVRRNTIIGTGGDYGVDHSSTDFSGVTINGNAIKGWAAGLRFHTGATYSHNGFESCTLRNSNSVGAEGTAGTGDVVGSLGLSSSYVPAVGSAVDGVGLHLQYATDRARTQRFNPPTIGAFEPIRQREART